jgi:DNA-binding LacI/PurR family transcriptional regulator
MAQVGLKDVAREAGVSYKTVSRVVNGENAVNPETRRRVEEAVARLGYRPNLLARNLRRGRTETLRLIIDQRQRLHVSENFQDDFIAGVIDRTTSAGYALLLEFCGPDSLDHLHKIADRRSDGIVMLGGRLNSPVIPAVRTAQIPAVVISNPLDSIGLGSVDADFVGGAVAMVRHLIGLGHRKIAHLADDLTIHSSVTRLLGYRIALEEAGIPFDPDLVVMTGSLRHEGFDAAELLFSNRSDVTALFCVNDLTAFGAIEYLRQSGRSVPGDVSVTGYDDIVIARYANPPLTTIHIPWYEMGDAATGAVIDLIENRTTTLIRETLSVELIVRETTGPAPGI